MALWAAQAAPPASGDKPLDKVFVDPALGSGGERYVGVAPGPVGKNPLPSPKADRPSLIWTGFQMSAAGSRVFLQTSGAVTYEVSNRAGAGKQPGTLSVLLRNCRIHLKNNRRNLDTRYFATPVRSVAARQKSKDVELVISLKEPSSPAPRIEAGPDGTQFVVLDFPPGKASQPPADDPAAAPVQAGPGGQGASDDANLPGTPGAPRAPRSGRR